MEFDDWELSAEELDFLENDAIKRIEEPSSSSCGDTCSSSKIDGASPALPRSLPSYAEPNKNANNSNLERPKLVVKFFLHSSGSIAAKLPFNQVLLGACHKIFRASWNAKERLWMFPILSLSSAEEAFSNISGINIELENLDPIVWRAITTASAVPDLQDRYILIPPKIESKLLPFQRDGIRYVLQHGGRALLADEMGLGKTLQALAVTSCIREAWPVLVITPSSLRLQWASMIQEWLAIPPYDILVVLSQWGGTNRSRFNVVASNAKRDIHLDGVFNIISYDIVPKFQDMLMTSEFKVVIADESHFLKNAQAKRTNACVPILQKAQFAILLSGTPALSRPIELFKQLQALYPHVYKSVHEYGNRYCKGGLFGVYQGASNHEELHNLMKSTVMIRRLKKDVLSELPMKRRQQVFLDLGEKEMKHINALFHELETIKRRIISSQSKEEAESLKFSRKNLINKLYTDSAEAKVPAVLDYLGTMIEAGCKFLIFAHHQSMIDAIEQFLLKKKVGCIRIDGTTLPATRQASVQAFQEKKSIQAAVLSIKAGGFGLTLTAASTVIFAELAWTPGDLIQAEDRAHRIGQPASDMSLNLQFRALADLVLLRDYDSLICLVFTNQLQLYVVASVSSVNVYYLLANDTVDDIIWDVVQSKLENLGQMLDGHENSLEVSDSQETCSPAKQKTIDSFMKRCSNSSEIDQKLKFPRH